MKITEIRQSNMKEIETKAFKPEQAEKKAATQIGKDVVDLSVNTQSWQKDILLSALDMLESEIKPDEVYPLDKIENRPIETYDEALIELRFLKTDKFKSEASAAQANIKASDILSLFVEDAA